VVQPAIDMWAASQRRSTTTSTPGWFSQCLCGLLRLWAYKARSQACATAYWRGTGLTTRWGCRVKYVLVVAPLPMCKCWTLFGGMLSWWFQDADGGLRGSWKG
jgi:hypothetical protein